MTGRIAAETPQVVTPDELAALECLGDGGRWTVGEHEVWLTNLDKVLIEPTATTPAVTKRDLVRHHAVAAPVLLPYLADRPVNLVRFPDGVGSGGFWQKAAPRRAPEWIRRWRDPDAGPGRTDCYLVLDSPAALAWAANQAVLELHPWTSTARRPQEPSWALIDIDPGADAGFTEALVLARLHRTALDHLGVVGGAKLTGKRGVHIWVPVAEGLTFAETSAWVASLSRAIGSTVPDLVSWAWRTADRRGRSRLDHTQNARNKTLVAPFSVRAAPGAPVSVPITWAELDDPELRPDRWTIRDLPERLATVGDPLADLRGRQQQLPALV